LYQRAKPFKAVNPFSRSYAPTVLEDLPDSANPGAIHSIEIIPDPEAIPTPEAVPVPEAIPIPEAIDNLEAVPITNPEAFRRELEIYRKEIEEQLKNRESPSKLGRLYDWFCDHVQKLDVAVGLIPDAIAIHGVKVKVSNNADG
jgi:hypothetical protein